MTETRDEMDSRTMRMIAIEEHFTTPDFTANSAATASIAQPGVWNRCVELMLDVADGRIAEMDAAGLDVQVLSLNSPGIQAEDDTGAAIEKSFAVNDLIRNIVSSRPDRLAGFAVLPLQDPEAAARELERGVTTNGLKGAMINGHAKGTYLDHPSFDVLWAKAQELDVPLYLHPANGIDSPHVLNGHPELDGPMWSWGYDVGSHVLRMIFGGVFDRHPKAKLIIGHMGEGLPYTLWRLDSRWEWHNHHGIELDRPRPSDYIRENVYITTSGVCDAAPLKCAIDAAGPDHVLFATDYPFEDFPAHTEFMRTAPIEEHIRAKIAHGNAERLLRL